MNAMSQTARIGGITLMLCLTGAGLAAQQILALDTGDRLVGQLRSVSDGVWVFRFVGGEARIAADLVSAFTAPDPIGLRLTDGTVSVASIAPDTGRLTLSLRDGSTRSVAPTEIEAVGDATELATLAPVRIGIFSPLNRFWGASGSVGFTDKTGNSRSRGVLVTLDVERWTAKDRLTFTAGLNREQSRNEDGGFTATVAKYYSTLRADIYLKRRLFVFAETRQDRDTFQDIALRSNYTGGLGLQLVAAEGTDLRLSGSGGARIEYFVSNGSAAIAILSIGADLRRKFGPATFAWKLGWIPNLEDFSDYRFRSEATLTTTVYQGLGLRLGILSEHDNQPRPGVDKYDMLLTITFAYSIRQRD